MENKKLGKLLIIVGIIIALVPSIIISAFSYQSGGRFFVPSYTFWVLFIIGIIIAIVGEYLDRK
jgi:undecaprenyl pyrophosphate phosphatase UppP